ncbi:tryptophan halogenase family protein [Brevundimonas sp. PAMC22021]|uniref:tryptophan halogenase family protein n=1 Tax=Brevundimonas sp. PAMC22021 TaxID=2861285 RepID=UPI001C629362|nr:tryptophan halogenase family protein [Brevundimonas sp. PAMC22021]QYF88142.1 tryptophan 7-halogenase [Brevundimonas sp. PAMC22021]
MDNTEHRPLRKICIVGGGTAGWIAAALMAEHFKGRLCEIELVESDEIGTIGVGESTVPPFLQLLAKLGVNEEEFVRETQASFKLGIQFRDWRRKGESYYHPFGVIGMPVDISDFYQVWLKARQNGYPHELQEFAPASVMMEQGRFTLPFKARKTAVGGAAYALHVDARQVALFLRRFAEARGVVRTEGRIEEVIQRPDGFVERVVLKDGRSVEADFFIDCSGFRALLIGKALDVGYEDWSHWLLCDRAIAVQTENVGPPPPYTLAHAQDAGWRWRIPLQHRTGNGYVFSSAHLSDDEATATLMSQVEGEPVVQPMVVPFKTGMRERIWHRNVLSLGLASGFIEPLESTAIHLVYRGMEFFFRYLPDRDCAPALADEFNRRMRTDYEEIRDFIILHYCTTQRDDTLFWRACAEMEPPETLRRKIDLFCVNGSLSEGVDELFRAVSWQSVMEGMGVRPRSYHPLVERIPFDGAPAQMDRARETLTRTVEGLPTHKAFIAAHCAAPSPPPRA